jgi:hypothetical protein
MLIDNRLRKFVVSRVKDGFPNRWGIGLEGEGLKGGGMQIVGDAMWKGG